MRAKFHFHTLENISGFLFSVGTEINIGVKWVTATCIHPPRNSLLSRKSTLE